MAGSSCVVISRHLGADVRRESFENDLAGRLVASGCRVLVLPPLYHLPHRSELWAEIAREKDAPVVAGWINARPLECLIREYADRDAHLALNLSDFNDAEAAHAAVVEVLAPAEGVGEIHEFEADVFPRWYPVIDRTRCTSCRHCLQFCLFGVYEAEERRVVAVRPDNCKDGCPACARVCPEGAIIFPLSDEAAIAGAPGVIMQPDAAARRMYYVRTGRECPVCGEISEPGSLRGVNQAAETCGECGRTIDGQAEAAPSPVHAEIDSLIDALDDLAAGGGGE